MPTSDTFPSVIFLHWFFLKTNKQTELYGVEKPVKHKPKYILEKTNITGFHSKFILFIRTKTKFHSFIYIYSLILFSFKVYIIYKKGSGVPLTCNEAIKYGNIYYQHQVYNTQKQMHLQFLHVSVSCFYPVVTSSFNC